MPKVIAVEYDKVFDTNYVLVKYSDKTTMTIEIEEDAEKGEELIFTRSEEVTKE